MSIRKHGRRFWAVYAPDGSLVCVTVYLRGAREVVRRLETLADGIRAELGDALRKP